jgi:hypothetical protein
VHSRGSVPTEPAGKRTLDIAVTYPREHEARIGGEVAEVDGVIGCCMMFDRDLWRRIGGFDMRYSPAGFEDFDFALGARLAGRKVFVLPAVRVVHRISMRNPRDPTSRRLMAMFRLRRTIGRWVPERIRAAVAAGAGLGDHDPARLELLRRHYGSWESKWGFDPLNPDMETVRKRYAGTEVLWAEDPELRAAGEDIIRRYTSPRSTIARH